MAYQSFEDLEVWQRGCRLSVDIFNAFADCKNFTLKDQIGRASLSIPCNIAEGSERGELRTQIYIARKRNLVGKPEFERFVRETKETSKMLEGLRRSILAKNKPKSKALAAEGHLKLNT